jgi:hypothetical protein
LLSYRLSQNVAPFTIRLNQEIGIRKTHDPSQVVLAIYHTFSSS